ncbi:MAG: GbsR/MarR family transcriptional regulator [Myxococcota bacterium]
MTPLLENPRLSHFVEESGVLFEEWGAPRMLGRIVGWLLCCDPAEQTAAQLCEVLRASKGSISTGTRSLLLMGVIEKLTRPGERAAYFRIGPGAWKNLMRRDAMRIKLMHEWSLRGLDMMASQSEAHRARLDELSGFLRFIDEEYPAFLERFDTWWTNQKEER